MLAAVAWQFRAPILGALAESYFESQGIVSAVEIGRVDREGLSGRVTLGDTNAPAFAADSIEVVLNNESWVPEIVEIRVVAPTLRARADAKGISIPSLQDWIDSLTRKAKERKHSRFVSDDLAISLNNLRAIVSTPGGDIELDGNARVKRGNIVFAQAAVRPVRLLQNGNVVRIDGVSLDMRATPWGDVVNAQLTGSLNDGQPRAPLEATNIRMSVSASGVRWTAAEGNISLLVPSMRVRLESNELRTAGTTVLKPDLGFSFANIRAAWAKGQLNGNADIRLVSTARISRDDAQRLIAALPLIGADKAMAGSFSDAAVALKLTANARASAISGTFGLQLMPPATLEGAGGATLRLDALRLDGLPNRPTGSFAAQLSGGGLPALTVTVRRFDWKRGDGAFEADMATRAHFDFAMLRGADLSGSGHASLHNGALDFVLAQCAQIKIGAVLAGRRIAVNRLAGAICPSGNAPLIASAAAGWKLSARARGFSLDIPNANAELSNGSGVLVLEGSGDGPPTGGARITAIWISDIAKAKRFDPVAGAGDVRFAGNTVNGQVALADGVRRGRIGQIKFVHSVTHGTGKATIDVPDLAFDPQKLQPVHLSPLLASIARAKGNAHFSGVVAWTPKGMTSSGLLTIERLDFATPVGTAHSLHSVVALKSLLPPITEKGQKLDISKIDWTLPITDLNTRFSVTPDAIRIEATTTSVAAGSASLDAFTIKLASAQRVQGIVRLANIDLAQLVAATNVGDKVKVEGHISGTVPFLSGPEGFRFAKGHLQSVGAGRLAIDRTLWTRGSPITNGVQDFAYQALENLAVTSMTADIDSVEKGRLRIVFHIKGRSDPPKAEEARVGLLDLMQGTAFDKPVALPKGTPIDLTLDTSLNFDELLRSYREAWSNTLVRVPKTQAHRGKTK